MVCVGKKNHIDLSLMIKQIWNDHTENMLIDKCKPTTMPIIYSSEGPFTIYWGGGIYESKGGNK